jgi:prepilin-type N-terminal cleavage/methylation domain-containing protein
MRARGFSLVELSIVVLVIGIVLTMGIGAWTANLENQANAATTQRQTAVKEALSGYLRRNSRLPCPDTDFASPDGVENRTTAGNPATACSARFGILPYVTLGLARDAVRDGWGNFFSYHVSNTVNPPSLSEPDDVPLKDWTLTSNFYAGNIGTITVNDRNGATVNAIATDVVAVIVSHGRNGFGAYTIGGTRNTLPAGTDELENTNGTANATYFRRDATISDAASGGAFDDQVMFLTAADLLDPMFRDGTMKPASPHTVHELLQKQKQLLIGYSMGYTNPSLYGGSNCNSSGSPYCRVILAADTSDGWVDGGNSNANGLVPYLNLGLTLATAIDPWGQRLRYTIHNTSIISTGSGGGFSSTYPAGNFVAMTLTSLGPDRMLGTKTPSGTTDDISLQITMAELRGSMVGLLP